MSCGLRDELGEREQADIGHASAGGERAAGEVDGAEAEPLRELARRAALKTPGSAMAPRPRRRAVAGRESGVGMNRRPRSDVNEAVMIVAGARREDFSNLADRRKSLDR